MAKESDYIQEELYRNSNFVHHRNSKILYYDCTNYYFEIEEESGDKKYGKNKEHRPNPIVTMGLFIDAGHCLKYSNKYYRMLDDKGKQIHYRKGTKVMCIKAFDGKKYCCVNDKDIYALEEIPEHEAKSKNFDSDYIQPKPKKKYILPMNHPWRRQSFNKFVKLQKHHENDDLVSA